MRIFILTVITLILLGVFGVVFFLPSVVEKQVKHGLTPYTSSEHIDIEYSVWKNELTIHFVKDSIFIPSSNQYLFIDTGKLSINDPSWFQYLKNQRIHADLIKMNVHQLHGRIDPEYKDSTRTVNRPTCLFKQVIFQSDSLQLSYGDYSISSGQQSLNFRSIHVDSSQVTMLPDQSDISSLHLVLPNGKQLLSEKISLGTDSLTLHDFEWRDNTKEKKRVYYQAKVDEITMVRNNAFRSFDIESIDHLIVEGMRVQIDDDGDQPPCDGKTPCIRPLIAEFVFTLPVKHTILATGELTYRFYQNQEIQSLVELEKIYAEAIYSYSNNNDKAVQMNWDVKTTINEEIPVRLTTRLLPSGRFDYQIKSQDFPMAALNPMIPQQEEYVIKIGEGQCQKLHLDVEGRARESTATFYLDYNDLKVDIKKSPKKKWLTRLLDKVTPIFVRNDYTTEEPLVHTVEFEEQRTFFYQIGQHINHGVKETILVF